MTLTETREQLHKPVESWQLLERIYEPAFYQVARFVSRNGGTLEDAKDIFHDAFVILYEQQMKGKIMESEISYVFGISRYLWYKKIKQDSQTMKGSETIFEVVFPEEPTINQTRLLAFLEQAGKRCMELLESFYFKGKDLKQIVKGFGFSSEHSASVQKYKCIEKIREAIKTKSITYEDFLE